MRRHYSTIDSLTRHELILSEASYNMACSFLESMGLICDTVKTLSLSTTELTFSNTERKFWYDEERGYLLGE